MDVFSFAEGLFGGMPPVLPFLFSGVPLFSGFLLALREKRERLFLPAAAAACGLGGLAALFSKAYTEGDAAALFLVTMSLASLLRLALCALSLAREKRKARRERLAEAGRRAVFTLPDRENTFLRDRLQTTLRTGPEEERGYSPEDDKLRLDHVRELIAKLRSAPLSAGDRLEAESMSRLITVYAGKELLTPAEARELNECLSAVLKMTAKYAL